METGPEHWTTREVAQFLRLFERDPRTREPDPTRPDAHKVHSLAFSDATFPRPIKLGKNNRYVVAEVRAWFASQPRGGTSIARPSEKPKRGRKAKAVQG